MENTPSLETIAIIFNGKYTELRDHRENIEWNKVGGRQEKVIVMMVH